MTPMDGIGWAEVVGLAKWPVVVIALGFMFKRPITQTLGRLTGVSAKGISASLDRQLGQRPAESDAQKSRALSTLAALRRVLRRPTQESTPKWLDCGLMEKLS